MCQSAKFNILSDLLQLKHKYLMSSYKKFNNKLSMIRLLNQSFEYYLGWEDLHYYCINFHVS